MKLKVVTAMSERPVHLSVLGLELELSNMPFGQELSITEGYDGSLTLSLQEPLYDSDMEDSDISPYDMEQDFGSEQSENTEPAYISVQHDNLLYELLSALRRTLSEENGVPPYIIFHDKTLREICRVMPESLEDMEGISGIGKVKREKYGIQVLEVVRNYRKNIAV